MLLEKIEKKREQQTVESILQRTDKKESDEADHELDKERNRVIASEAMIQSGSIGARNLMEARDLVETAMNRIGSSVSFQHPDVVELLTLLRKTLDGLADKSSYSSASPRALSTGQSMQAQRSGILSPQHRNVSRVEMHRAYGEWLSPSSGSSPYTSVEPSPYTPFEQPGRDYFNFQQLQPGLPLPQEQKSLPLPQEQSLPLPQQKSPLPQEQNSLPLPQEQKSQSEPLPLVFQLSEEIEGQPQPQPQQQQPQQQQPQQQQQQVQSQN